MSFDSTCKYLAEKFPQDIATWLLGQPIRADSLIFLESKDTILHVEFQVDPKADVPFRLADYRLRLYRRSPDKTVRQIVIYLRRSNSPLVSQTTFNAGGLHHEYEVIRLWEQPVTPFLQLPGLLPFAALCDVSDRTKMLQQVAPKIDAIANRTQQSDIAATTALLAGLVLKGNIINRILRQDVMKESVIYQEITATADAQGFYRGERSLILGQLQHRFETLTPKSRSQVEALPLEQLEDLGKALLDFSSEADLDQWLQNNL